MDVKKKLDTTKERVRLLLEKYPICRNDDRFLIMYYWKKFNMYPFFISPTHVAFLDSPETIRRVRQKIQAEGEFPPTNPKVKVKRELRRRAFHKYFSKKEKGCCS